MTIIPRQITGVRSSTGQHHSTLLDSNLSTVWTDSREDAWVELDLGTKQKFNAMNIVFGDFVKIAYQFSIFVGSDQMSWTRVYNANSNRGVIFNMVRFDTVEERYVKLVIHRNDSANDTKAQIAYLEVLYEEEEKAEGTTEEIEPIHEGAPEMPVIEEEFDKVGLKKMRETDPNGISAYFGPGTVDQSWFDHYERHGYKSLPNIKVWRKELGFNKRPHTVNVEFKIYVKVDELLPSFDKIQAQNPGIGDGCSLKLIGGPHDDSNSSAGCYIFHFPYKGGFKNNCQKEKPHPDYDKNTIAGFMALPEWVGTGKYVGLGAIVEQTGPKEVQLTALFDADGLIDGKPANNWGILWQTTDKGQLGKHKGTGKVWTTPNGKLTQIRMDNVAKSTDVKYASLREIIAQ